MNTITEQERMKLLNKICDLSKAAKVPENQMNSIRTPHGYILTITNLCTRDEDACGEFLEGLEAAGLSVSQSHPVSVRTIYIKSNP